MRITKKEHQELRRRSKPTGEAVLAATHGWVVGDIAIASHDITAGLFQAEVLVTAGTRLVVRGLSGNALHPIAVSKESDAHHHLAVSASNLCRPERRVMAPPDDGTKNL
jgi:hypothetical protein